MVGDGAQPLLQGLGHFPEVVVLVADHAQQVPQAACPAPAALSPESDGCEGNHWTCTASPGNCADVASPDLCMSVCPVPLTMFPCHAIWDAVCTGAMKDSPQQVGLPGC